MYENWARADKLDVRSVDDHFTCLYKAKNGFAYLGGHNPETNLRSIFIISHEAYEALERTGRLAVLRAGDDAYVSPEEANIAKMRAQLESGVTIDEIIAQETTDFFKKAAEEGFEAAPRLPGEENDIPPWMVIAHIHDMGCVLVQVTSPDVTEDQIISDIQEALVYRPGNPDLVSAARYAALRASGLEETHAEISSNDGELTSEELYRKGGFRAYIFAHPYHVRRAQEQHLELILAEDERPTRAAGEPLNLG